MFCWGNISTACGRGHSPDLLSAERQSVAQQAQHHETHCFFMALFASFFGHRVYICQHEGIEPPTTIHHIHVAAQPYQCLAPIGSRICQVQRLQRFQSEVKQLPQQFPFSPARRNLQCQELILRIYVANWE